MARPLRIQFENAYYRVTCRGNAQQAIFKSDTDRTAFLDLLKRSGETLSSSPFCTPLANLPALMRHFRALICLTAA
jgi:hypothetical protein